jgi:hypothetical protein
MLTVELRKCIYKQLIGSGVILFLADLAFLKLLQQPDKKGRYGKGHAISTRSKTGIKGGSEGEGGGGRMGVSGWEGGGSSVVIIPH